MTRVSDKLCIVSAALCIVTSVGHAKTTEPTNIYGGAETATCEWPSVVSLEGGCSGTLVHPQMVLYAAHCGVEFDEVWFGESIFAPARIIDIDQCQVLPSGAPGNGDDLAYCTLVEAQVDVPIIPVLSEQEFAAIAPGSAVTLVGFGVDENYTAGFKRAVTTTLGQTEPNNEVFIGGDGLDSCIGDSGGPAIVRLPPSLDANRGFRVLGVVSHGQECGAGGYYSLAHRGTTWIEENSGVSLNPSSSSPTHAQSSDWTLGCSEAEYDSGIGCSVGTELGFNVWVFWVLLIAGVRRREFG